MRRFSFVFFCVSGLVSGLACGLTACSATPAAPTTTPTKQAPAAVSFAMPFAIDKLTEAFSGTVDEVVFVDGYVYVAVAPPPGQPGARRWCVSLKKRVVVGDTVDVRAFGRADHFHSKKLDRDFDALWFAVLTVTTQTPGEST